MNVLVETKEVWKVFPSRPKKRNDLHIFLTTVLTTKPTLV